LQPPLAITKIIHGDSQLKFKAQLIVVRPAICAILLFLLPAKPTLRIATIRPELFDKSYSFFTGAPRSRYDWSATVSVANLQARTLALQSIGYVPHHAITRR
jgi:hypothetical protein